MADEFINATLVIDASPEAIFDVLADPAKHPAVDGTGWVVEPVDKAPLATPDQIFQMHMFHPQHPDGDYEIHNKVVAFDRPNAIAWKPGYVADDKGTLGFGGWLWRYDLTPDGDGGTEVTLTYDWSEADEAARERFQFPHALPPGHLENSLDHLAGLLTNDS